MFVLNPISNPLAMTLNFAALFIALIIILKRWDTGIFFWMNAGFWVGIFLTVNYQNPIFLLLVLGFIVWKFCILPVKRGKFRVIPFTIFSFLFFAIMSFFYDVIATINSSPL
jgi:hypothetical protein